jgi:hypothetical protein
MTRHPNRPDGRTTSDAMTPSGMGPQGRREWPRLELRVGMLQPGHDAAIVLTDFDTAKRAVQDEEEHGHLIDRSSASRGAYRRRGCVSIWASSSTPESGM